jgi:hypothetical protein
MYSDQRPYGDGDGDDGNGGDESDDGDDGGDDDDGVEVGAVGVECAPLVVGRGDETGVSLLSKSKLTKY